MKAWVVPCNCGAVTGMPPPGSKNYQEKGQCVVCGATIYARKGSWMMRAEQPKPQPQIDLLEVE